MTRSLFFIAVILVAAGCGASQKHAESPDGTETGWSDPKPALTSAKTDRPIQPEVAAAEPPTTSPPAPASSGTSSGATGAVGTGTPDEAAIVSGNALPPPPVGAGKGATAPKAHKKKKGKKKAKS